MPSDSHNLTMAKATGLIFFTVWHHFSSRSAFCHITVHTMHSSWTYQCPPFCLLTTKSVDFVVDTWWLPFIMEIIRNFHSSYICILWLQKFFSNGCWSILLYNKFSNEASSFQMIIDITGHVVPLFWCGMHGFTSNNKAVLLLCISIIK